RAEGNLLAGRNPPEDFRVPDGNIRVIEVLRTRTTTRDFGDAALLQHDAGGKSGPTQGKSDIMATFFVRLDQARNVDVRQDVAAINKERFLPERRLNILNAAA